MHPRERRASLGVRVRKLAIAGLVAAAGGLCSAAAPTNALDCEGVRSRRRLPLHHHRRRHTPTRIDGYVVTNADGVPMWDFVRDREALAIGYPISQRWTEGPFTLQAFQKVILQWDSRASSA